MDTSLFPTRTGARRWLTALLATGALAIAALPAQAQIPGLNFYVGGGLGQSNADVDDLQTPNFDDEDFAWKLFGGARLFSFFGAELNYIDFGNPGGDDATLDYEGVAGFGMVYLPITMFDLYAKAGLARVSVDVDPLNLSTDDTNFAYGVGVQVKFGQLAVRGEYERFEVKDGDLDLDAKPSLFTLGFSYSFL
jgi:opacity protein-like surface antigen